MFVCMGGRGEGTDGTLLGSPTWARKGQCSLACWMGKLASQCQFMASGSPCARGPGWQQGCILGPLGKWPGREGLAISPDSVNVL